MLTVSVQNFGPIAEGSVDLKPLTIFVGPSNTGKSYMATAIWAVTQAFQPDGFPFQLKSRDRRAFYRASFGRGGLQDKNAEAGKSLRNWIEGLNSPLAELSEFSVSDLPEAARLDIEESTRQWLDELQATVTGRLRQAYGHDSEFARNKRTEDFSLAVHRDEPLLNMDVRLTPQGKPMPEFDVSSASASLPEYLAQRPMLPIRSDVSEIAAEEILATARIAAMDTVSSSFPSGSYYLPAARSGIAQGHKVLAAALVRQSSRIGLEPISIPTLPGVATEFLSNLLRLDKRMVGRPEFTKELDEAVAFIERDVLHGKIELDESDGLPTSEIVYLPDAAKSAAGKYALDHTSSMVSELAPLILFLKYLVNPGDLLILEEPESHLHPAAQLQMARGIARLVNAGVQVLITTHSDDFMGQINNLISMSNVSEKTAESLGLEQEECLYPEQVSAYGFRINKDLGGAETYPLPVGSDVGIEDEEFLPVAELLYKQALALQDARLK